jgi:hypothetical protein
MGLEARLNAALWKPVTNRDVTEAADPDCRKCDGKGMDFTDRGNPAVCACAKDRFYRTYAGRIRRRDGQMEFKPLVQLAGP